MSLINQFPLKTKEGQMALWKIEEPLSFFEEQLHGWEIPDGRSERRKLEFAASRFVLQQLVPDFPVKDLAWNEKGKPFLPDCDLHFSISHSYPYVGVAIQEGSSIGLDVQTYEPKIQRLQDKFLSAEEQSLALESVDRITLFWSMKEAAYKWFGEGGMDFKKHMIIKDWQELDNYIALNMDFQHPLQQKELILQGKIEQEYAWACTSPLI